MASGMLGRLVAARRAVPRRSMSTVFALSSGRGRCGVAVIRVSGPASADALLTLTGRRCLPAARRAVVGGLYCPADGGLLDRALLLWLPGPASFTGEDSCELHTHGGPAVVAAVLRALAAVPGLRPARPGDFTRRAFHSGRLDVTQVEGLADLIAAETEQQRRQAVRQAEGHLRRQYGRWRSALLRCLATVEAVIDFGEEELIEAGALPETAAAAARLADDMQRHLQDGRRGERLRSGVRVTIAGAPNVGKSSLLNALVEREAAIVSARPGTTRDLLDIALDVAGFPVLLTDTAGLRVSPDALEREGVRRARGSADAADLRLLVVDARRALRWLDGSSAGSSAGGSAGSSAGGSAGDTAGSSAGPGRPVAEFVSRQLRALRLSEGPPSLLVLNKADLVPAAAAARLSGWCGSERAELLSCRTGVGLPRLAGSLGRALSGLCGDPEAAPAITRERHRQQVAAAETHLRRFLGQLEGGDLALAAEQLRRAAAALGHLTGHLAPQDVLDHIFSQFCIGK